MKPNRLVLLSRLFVTALVAAAPSVRSQEITGTIDKLTFMLEPEQPAAPESKAELGATPAPEPDPIDTSKH